MAYLANSWGHYIILDMVRPISQSLNRLHRHALMLFSHRILQMVQLIVSYQRHQPLIKDRESN